MEEVLLMPIDVPRNPKVYTTVYDNFKGVDYTNDSTNIWRRRTPTGTNMLPDASGRPFKRHGWDILLSQAQICTALGVDSCIVQKCAYFELAGEDHIVVFTDGGILFYSKDHGITATNTDPDCFSSFDRCFFFEGGGTSAFYIYGNYKVWIYDSTFTLRDATDEAHIPSVIITATADGTGVVNEPYNLLRNMAAVEYQDCDLFTYWGTQGLVFEVKDDWKTGKTQGNPSLYKWQYDEDNSTWTTVEGSTAFDSTNIVAPNPKDGDEIVIVYAKGLMLPNNVDNTSQHDEVKVFTSNILQYDTEIEYAAVLAQGYFTIHTDSVSRDNRQAWIEFDYRDTYKTSADAEFKGEDTFKVIFPSAEIVVTTVSSANAYDNGNATLVGGDA